MATTVDTQHPAYQYMAPLWRRARIVIQGEEAVKADRETFLPRLGGMSEEEYNIYLDRAAFFEGTGRTSIGFRHLIFRRPIIEQLQGEMAFIANDMTLTNVSLKMLVRKIVGEMIDVSRFGVLIDYPPLPSESSGVTSPFRRIRENRRPYVTTYYAEDIINWRQRLIGNRLTTVMIVLREFDLVQDETDRFAHDTRIRYRVLELDEEGYYRQQVYEYGVESVDAYLVEEIYPTRQGQRMRRIPFHLFTLSEDGYEPARPFLMPLINTNLSHYKNSADMEWGSHLTALPTLTVSGVEPCYNPDTKEKEMPRIRVGGTAALLFPNPETSAKYLEFSGAGLASLETRLEVKERHMAVFGLRALAQEQRIAETAEATAMRFETQNATLAGLVTRIETTLAELLDDMADWQGVPLGNRVVMNKDYLPAGMTSQMVNSLAKLVEAGEISGATLWEALQGADIVTTARTYDDELELLQLENRVAVSDQDRQVAQRMGLPLREVS